MAGLLEHTVERARCQIVAELAWNGHPAGLGGMLELTMATAICDKDHPSSRSRRSMALTFIRQRYRWRHPSNVRKPLHVSSFDA
jgi:hypothetical protein